VVPASVEGLLCLEELGDEYCLAHSLRSGSLMSHGRNAIDGSSVIESDDMELDLCSVATVNVDIDFCNKWTA
jgi:hypothetical protein